MRHHLLTLTALCLLLAACGKEAQYSTWTVNGEGFSTNRTEVMEAYRQGLSGLAGGELENRFSIDFNFGELPSSGKYIIHYVRSNTHYYEALIGFWYNSNPFYPSPSEEKYLEASQKNGKVSYHMPPTWFINGRNSNDSVLVEGTFKEP